MIGAQAHMKVFQISLSSDKDPVSMFLCSTRGNCMHSFFFLLAKKKKKKSGIVETVQQILTENAGIKKMIHFEFEISWLRNPLHKLTILFIHLTFPPMIFGYFHN